MLEKLRSVKMKLWNICTSPSTRKFLNSFIQLTVLIDEDTNELKVQNGVNKLSKYVAI